MENDEDYVRPEDNRCIFRPRIEGCSAELLHRLRQQNNPGRERVGAFTGRCAHCGSTDLWDDNMAYDCNKCGAFLGGN